MPEASRPLIPVLLCIDVEPDQFCPDPSNPRPWTGFERTVPYLQEFRERMAAAAGRPVRFVWCLRMGPQIAKVYGSAGWIVEQYPEFVHTAREHGDVLGLHVHTYRWLEAERRWDDDLGDPDWVAECLESSTAHYRRLLGDTCRVLRFGNFWTSTEAVNHAEELGIRYDLTPEPGLPPNTFTPGKPVPTGELPDFYRIPRVPYVPSREDYRKPATVPRDITLIPLTSGKLDLGLDPAEWPRRLSRAIRNGWGGRDQSIPLSMWRAWSGRNTFDRMLQRALRAQEKPYLALAIHSKFPGAPEFDAVDASFRALLESPERKRFWFCSPEEALGVLGGISSST